ncbi:hypothetical protein F383_17664 [Gossypium arboreum]|uniref:Uncharacterized protein n=1 Tax=Gossypium arboreum TaxID=29729 RepID=A0A0B0NL66_GOSAR|nr:hypothetical protein F383_17664 [Gossypium arboreum]
MIEPSEEYGCNKDLTWTGDLAWTGNLAVRCKVRRSVYLR